MKYESIIGMKLGLAKVGNKWYVSENGRFVSRHDSRGEALKSAKKIQIIMEKSHAHCASA